MASTTAATEASAAKSASRGRWIRWSAVLLCALGWTLSVYLLQITGGARAENPWLQALCHGAKGEDRTFDCESILHSRYAFVGGGRPEAEDTRATRGLPWGAMGAAYFGFVGLWYLFVGPPTRSRAWWHALIMLVVAAGALSSLELIRIMAFELRRWCPACLVVHAINGVILLLTVAAFPWRKQRAAVRPHPTTGLALATLFAGFFLAQAHFLYTHAKLAATGYRMLETSYLAIVNDPAFARWDYEREPVVSIPLRVDDVVLGSPDVPHTVVAFVDFQCRACRLACETLADLLDKHPDRLRVVYRHFPLDESCNATQTGSPHPAACDASRAVEAARFVGGPQGFDAMRKLLYERHYRLDGAPYDRWAAELGMDRAAFVAAFDSIDVRARIQTDIALGEKLGLNAVPVLFLDGRRLEHWRNRKVWLALLDGEDETPAAEPAAP